MIPSGGSGGENLKKQAELLAKNFFQAVHKVGTLFAFIESDGQ
jgi:hypothetical protein